MEAPTGYHEKLIELSRDLVNHGWGESKLIVSSLKDNTTKIEIFCGKSYVFFVKKEIEIDASKLL